MTAEVILAKTSSVVRGITKVALYFLVQTFREMKRKLH